MILVFFFFLFGSWNSGFVFFFSFSLLCELLRGLFLHVLV